MMNILWFFYNEIKKANGCLYLGQDNFIIELFLNFSLNLILYQFEPYSYFEILDFDIKEIINQDKIDLTPEFLKTPENIHETDLEKKIRQNRRLFYPFQDEKTLNLWEMEYKSKR